MPQIFYTTAVLARELRISQSHLQRLLADGKLARPAGVLVGIGEQHPQHCFTQAQINIMKVAFKRQRARRKKKS